jgi:phosphoribosylamine--glycine ligase
MAYLQEERIVYRGVLYVGLMITQRGPYVLEFNVRFGDPEAEAILPRIDEDLYAWFVELAQGQLLKRELRVSQNRTVAVVLASEGYPEHPRRGRLIEIEEAMPRAVIFHAGTANRDGNLVSSGGRVLTVVGIDNDFGGARSAAYAQIDRIRLDGGQIRRDIGLTSEAGG